MKSNLVFYFLLSFCFNGCSLKIYSDFDHDISFAKYKTFGWSANDTSAIKNNPLYYSELSDKVIKREVELQLKEKGYRFSELHPDLRMNYHFVADSWTTAANPDPFGHLYDYYWLNRTIHLEEGRAGTLIIDLADPKTDLLVWRGWAINFKSQKRPRQIVNQIKKATQIIFKEFPRLKK